MFQFKKYISSIGLSVGMICLSACINEDSARLPDMSESDMVTVNFCIPQHGPTFGIGSTRAGAYDEGDVSNLYIVAVQTSYFNYLGKDDDTTGSNVKEDPNDSSLKYIEQDMTGVRDRVIIFPLNVYEFDSTFDRYTDYKITLYPGRYRFYAVANCDLYTNGYYTASGSYTEKEIMEAVMKFTSDTQLRVSHLPMACKPQDIRYGKNAETAPKPKEEDNHTIPIYKNNKDIIFADLEFLCSKVRYTILFDATQRYYDEESETYKEGISVGFGNQSIRFYVDDSSDTNPSVTKIREKSAVFTEDISLIPDVADPFSFIKSGEENATWTLSFNRYEWPASGAYYPRYAAEELVLWDASKGLDEWKDRRQKAWQGVVYLPENNDTRNQGAVDHTELRFPYIVDWFKEASEYGDTYIDGEYDPDNFKTIYLFGDNGNEHHYYGGSSEDDMYKDQDSGYAITHGLVRGKFYDVVARVVNPERWDLDIIVYGQIKEWHDVDQNLEETDSGTIKDGQENPVTSVNTESKDWNYNKNNNNW